jgi:hypothetical protein
METAGQAARRADGASAQRLAQQLGACESTIEQLGTRSEELGAKLQAAEAAHATTMAAAREAHRCELSRALERERSGAEEVAQGLRAQLASARADAEATTAEAAAAAVSRRCWGAWIGSPRLRHCVHGASIGGGGGSGDGVGEALLGGARDVGAALRRGGGLGCGAAGGAGRRAGPGSGGHEAVARGREARGRAVGAADTGRQGCALARLPCCCSALWCSETVSLASCGGDFCGVIDISISRWASGRFGCGG